ncbi:MAG TPA: hypothetical protein VN625_00335 [Desulfuromonadaceae bacterium]|nr:hypothetical protein [Desulfuromonadaceae bacterium]
MNAARANVLPSPAVVAYSHLIFYRKTVARLIEANILPESAAAQFDATFSTALSRSTAVQYDRSMAYHY